ncbi:hypothetical protein [Pedobacter miscanthi]|uniref:Uncharacterized protein n=1 Tax=Pedobacter miscanthi TaxID=2259170 RepID=A0A366KP62_9SPHI|nr:hypothetical protein [Pedobacter miscanthi]RBQ03456.1 hypothetical protein DRW42_21955 [Pedobacter miscanthi]
MAELKTFQKSTVPAYNKPDWTDAPDFFIGQKGKRDWNQRKGTGTCFSDDFTTKARKYKD